MSNDHWFRPHLIRLGKMHKLSVHIVTIVLFVTGAAWLIFHHWVRIQGEFGPINHPMEPWLMRIHGAAAMVAILILGTLIPVHIRPALKIRRNVIAGITLTSLQVILIVTGYALYYFSGELSRSIASMVHWVLGLATPVILIWHVKMGKTKSG